MTPFPWGVKRASRVAKAPATKVTGWVSVSRFPHVCALQGKNHEGGKRQKGRQRIGASKRQAPTMSLPWLRPWARERLLRQYCLVNMTAKKERGTVCSGRCGETKAGKDKYAFYTQYSPATSKSSHTSGETTEHQLAGILPIPAPCLGVAAATHTGRGGT